MADQARRLKPSGLPPHARAGFPNASQGRRPSFEQEVHIFNSKTEARDFVASLNTRLQEQANFFRRENALDEETVSELTEESKRLDRLYSVMAKYTSEVMANTTRCILISAHKTVVYVNYVDEDGDSHSIGGRQHAFTLYGSDGREDLSLDKKEVIYLAAQEAFAFARAMELTGQIQGSMVIVCNDDLGNARIISSRSGHGSEEVLDHALCRY